MNDSALSWDGSETVYSIKVPRKCRRQLLLFRLLGNDRLSEEPNVALTSEMA